MVTTKAILILLLFLIAHLFFLSLTSYVASCRAIESRGCLVIISIWKTSAGIFSHLYVLHLLKTICHRMELEGIMITISL
jgi:hypothetical protein